MSEKRLKALKEAIEVLRDAEWDTVERLSHENSADNRKQFKDINDTLKALRMALREEESKVVRILKRLHILPG